MRLDYKYDVFICFSHKDLKAVENLHKRLLEFKLRVFWDKELEKGTGFTEKIREALKDSLHFVSYYTKNASESGWVGDEMEYFYEHYHEKDKENRRMYILPIPTSNKEKISRLYGDINFPKDKLNLISEIVKATYINSDKDYQKKRAYQKIELDTLKIQLENEIKKGSEARDYYRHNRFWRPITEKKDVHIFTCARDVPGNLDNKRGQGGRTNIDMWDYRSVFDITHFFASNYPNTKVTIEDPVSKLGDNDLKEAVRLAVRIAQMRSMLENKDCIIIGSPDVSDFAEIVLAELHMISPYSTKRDKRKGFVLVKEKKYTRSAFYWEKQPNEEEGIAQIIKPKAFEFLSHIGASEDGSSGKMYGILVVANNPWGKSNKIVILSGFSGIATNAIAKILTSEECLEEFFKLDQAYLNIDRPIEALIGVKYTVDRHYSERDTRKIENYKQDITFERLVEI